MEELKIKNMIKNRLSQTTNRKFSITDIFNKNNDDET